MKANLALESEDVFSGYRIVSSVQVKMYVGCLHLKSGSYLGNL
jgi:hypothetical protein